MIVRWTMSSCRSLRFLQFCVFASALLVTDRLPGATMTTSALLIPPSPFLSAASRGGGALWLSDRRAEEEWIFLSRKRRRRSSRSRSVVVSMGIRSFLGIGKGRKDDNRDSDTPSSDGKVSPAADPAAASNGATGTKSVGDAPPTSPPPSSRRQLRMGEDPKTREVDVRSIDRQESIQERINRVKSGKMTEEEKNAFLQTALSAGNTADSRKPLRTPLPTADDDDGKRMRASPFPSDSILRNFARGSRKKAGSTLSSLRSGSDDRSSEGGGRGGSGGRRGGGTDSQRKKREYLNMVTDPDRFNRYYTGDPSSVGVSPISGSVKASSKTPIGDIKKLDRSDAATRSSARTEPIRPASAPTSSSSSSVDTMPNDLGARLGAAAMVNENIRQKAEEDRKVKEERLKRERLERERQAAELTRQRQQEIDRQHQAQQAQKATEEKEAARVEAEKKRQEEERLKELMKAQDEYWSKKINAEKEAMMRRHREQGRGGARPEERTEKKTVKQKQDVEGDEVDPSSSANFDSVEMDLLEMVERDQEEALKERKGRKPGTPGGVPVTPTSLNDVQSEEELARDKEAFEMTRDEQLRRLKALNSPLPTASGPPPPPPPPKPAAFRPQRPVSSSKRSPSRVSVDGLLEDANGRSQDDGKQDELLNRNTKSDEGGMSISQLTRKKESLKKEPRSPWAGLLGKRRNQDGPKQKPQQLAANKRDPSPTPHRAPPRSSEQQKTEPAPKRKGPIRMQLPLGDDDGDDEDGINVDTNKGMSIAEAMKRTTGGTTVDQEERSRKWGVDMSRFLDDE